MLPALYALFNFLAVLTDFTVNLLAQGFCFGIYSSYSKDVVRPSAEECVRNPRARSTKMRWAVRAEE